MIRMDEAEYFGTVELSVAIKGPPNNAAASKIFGRLSEIYRDFVARPESMKNLMDYLVTMEEIYRRLSVCYRNLRDGEKETQDMLGILVEKQDAEQSLLGMELTPEEKGIVDKLRNTLSGEYQTLLIEESSESLEVYQTGNMRN